MSASSACPNCDYPLYGQFCSHCGQNQKGSDRYFWSLVADALEGLFDVDSKVWRTLFCLFFRPGHLTKQHFANKRARYVSPFRLYLVSSLVFFLLLSSLTYFADNLKFDIGGGVEAGQEIIEGEQGAVLDTNSEARIASETSTTDAENDPSESSDIQGTIENLPPADIQLPFVDEEKEKVWGQALTEKAQEAYTIGSQNPKVLVEQFLDTAPIVMFLLLPIFALILKLLYIRRRRFYTQHLVLAVHNHSFFFVSMALLSSLPIIVPATFEPTISVLLGLWMVMYMVVSLRVVFEQSWIKTIIKSGFLFLCYLILIMFAFVITAILGIIFL